MQVTAAEYTRLYLSALQDTLDRFPPPQPSEAAVNLLVTVGQQQEFLLWHSLLPPPGHPGSLDALEVSPSAPSLLCNELWAYPYHGFCWSPPDCQYTVSVHARCCYPSIKRCKHAGMLTSVSHKQPWGCREHRKWLKLSAGPDVRLHSTLHCVTLELRCSCTACECPDQ